MPPKPSVDPKVARDWIAAHPGATVPDLRRAFPELSDTTARRWLADAPPVEEHALVSEMGEDDRTRLLRTARNYQRALDAYAASLFDRGQLRTPDRDEAAAALSWAKSLDTLLKSHPDLLKVANDEPEENETGDDGDALSRVGTAIGLKLVPDR